MEQAERDSIAGDCPGYAGSVEGGTGWGAEEALDWRPAPGKWSINEIVCHMRDAERLGYLHRYTEILTKDNPTFPDVDGDALALERQYRRANLRDVLRDWRAARKACLAVLKKVKANQWTRIGTHATAGPMSLETVLQRQALGNDEAHLVQIENIKKRWELSKPRRRRRPWRRSFAVSRTTSYGGSPRPKNGPCWRFCAISGTWRVLCGAIRQDREPRPAPAPWINQDELAAKLRYNEDDPALVPQGVSGPQGGSGRHRRRAGAPSLATGGHASNARRGQLRLVRRAPGRA